MVAAMPVLLSAQDVRFHFVDGGTVSLSVPDIRSSDVEGDLFRVFQWDSTTYTWSLASITRIGFDDVVTEIGEEASVSGSLRVFPNPAADEVKISFHSVHSGAVKVKLYDSRGVMVRVLQWSAFGSGAQTVWWDTCDDHGDPVPSGSYLCQISEGPKSLTTQVIIVR